MTQTRLEAKALGLTRYFSGRACKNGHLADRFTACGYCVTCHDARVVAKGADLIAYYRQRYEQKKPEILKKQRAQRACNSQARTASVMAWQAANPEKVRWYKQQNKFKRRCAIGKHSPRDISNLLRIQRGECAGCSANIRAGHHTDHIIPLTRGGTNWCGNLQLLCATCNLQKSSLLPADWRRRRFSQQA